MTVNDILWKRLELLRLKAGEPPRTSVLILERRRAILEKRYKNNYIQLDNGKMAGSYPAGSPTIGKKSVDKSVESGIIEIGKSLSAATKNYSVRLPDSRQHVKLAENQIIEGTAFMGKGTKTELNVRFDLEREYRIPADEWRKLSGKGKIVVKGKTRLVELHWYEAKGEIVEMKAKRYLDES